MFAAFYNKLNDVQDLLTQHSMHILGVSETWLKPHDNDMMTNTNHYRVFRCDRSQQVAMSGGGGVCMFVHDQLHAKCASFPNPDCLEMCAVTVVNQGTKMLIVCVYRPPSSSVSWWDSLRDALESLTNTYPIAIKWF